MDPCWPLCLHTQQHGDSHICWWYSDICLLWKWHKPLQGITQKTLLLYWQWPSWMLPRDWNNQNTRQHIPQPTRLHQPLLEPLQHDWLPPTGHPIQWQRASTWSPCWSCCLPRWNMQLPITSWLSCLAKHKHLTWHQLCNFNCCLICQQPNCPTHLCMQTDLVIPVWNHQPLLIIHSRWQWTLWLLQCNMGRPPFVKRSLFLWICLSSCQWSHLLVHQAPTYSYSVQHWKWVHVTSTCNTGTEMVITLSVWNQC